MLSKSFTFFLGILTVLLVTAVYFPGTATAQSEEPQLIRLPSEEFLPEGFIVYGKAPTQEKAGIIDDTVRYRQTIDPLPDLELFFEFGGTLELLTTNFSLSKHDVVISEILWGTDGNYPTDGDDTYTQWIELYNTYPGGQFRPLLFLLFTPFANHPDRRIVELPNGQRALVLDAVSNLHLGRWDLPGRSGRRPYSNVVSAYRDITYPNRPNSYLRRANVPLGSYSGSWKATPERGRRNTLLSIVDDRDRVVELPYIATPGREHVPDAFLRALSTIPVRSNQVIINEVRNDVSEDNLDWIELKNVSRSGVQLKDWELSIVTGVGKDIDLVDLPYYEMSAGEILLLQPRHPKSTVFAGGINIEDPEARARGATHKYFVVPGLNLPNAGKFVLLLRSESDKNGQDAAIADYAGNGFFVDTSIAFNTEFWPRRGQPRPTNVADFGLYGSFGALDSAWARKPPYNRDAGHHKDAWERVGTQGGVGYAPGADRAISPGTPGYENKALKTRIDDGNFRATAMDNQYNSGEITISEVMSDGGPRRNKAQWIELYNSSFTQAINLEGWELEVRNLEDDVVPYVNGSFIFNAAIILPNQTLLLVSKRGPNNVAENRVYDLRDQHRSELKLSNRWSSLLNPDGFYLKLTDKGDPRLNADDIVVDEVGNLKIEKNGTPTLVNIPDANLEAIVRTALGLTADAPLTQERMPSLTTLDASGREIADLTGLETATALTTVNLSNNAISNVTPLAGLTGLTSLNLSENEIIDVAALSGLTSLLSLNLSENEITDVEPLSGLVNLVGLVLSDNPVTNAEWLSLLPDSVSIDIPIPAVVTIPDTNLAAVVRRQLDLAAGAPITQEQMLSLNSLDAKEKQISNITGLEYATGLTWLRLRDNQISDISPLAGLTSLTTLGLANNEIVDVSPLAELTSLTALELNNNEIRDIASLTGLTNLRKLRLGGNQIWNTFPLTSLTNLNDVDIEISQYAPWDVNEDGNVDIADLLPVALAALGGAAEPVNPRVDINGDGTVDISDLLFVADNLDEPVNTAPLGGAGAALPDEVAVSALDAEQLRTQITILRAESDGTVKYKRLIDFLEGLLVKICPNQTRVLPNYPNPFNPETWIPYQLAKASDVQITIYDGRGTVVRRLELGHQREGYYTSRNRAAYWDGRNAIGERVASGLYFYQLQADNMSLLRKMVILK